MRNCLLAFCQERPYPRPDALRVSSGWRVRCLSQYFPLATSSGQPGCAQGRLGLIGTTVTSLCQSGFKHSQTIPATKRCFVVQIDECSGFTAHTAGNRKWSAEYAPLLLPYPETTESLRPGFLGRVTIALPVLFPHLHLHAVLPFLGFFAFSRFCAFSSFLNTSPMLVR